VQKCLPFFTETPNPIAEIRVRKIKSKERVEAPSE
jgi:hypothetical protein